MSLYLLLISEMIQLGMREIIVKTHVGLYVKKPRRLSDLT